MHSRASRLTSIFLIFLALESPAFAYLDGATGSIILQAMIGGVAGAMVYFRLLKERAKALFARVTGRGPNPTGNE